MQIIRKGRKPAETFEAECQDCECLFRFHEEEATLVSSMATLPTMWAEARRTAATFKVVCPMQFCQAEVYKKVSFK